MAFSADQFCVCIRLRILLRVASSLPSSRIPELKLHISLISSSKRISSMEMSLCLLVSAQAHMGEKTINAG